MKLKILYIPGILTGVLVILYVLAVPAAPLWVKLGVKPVCITGNLPQIKFTACPEQPSAQFAAAPRPLPTPSADSPIPIIVDDDGSPDGMIALLYFLNNPLFEVKAVTISCGEAHPDLFAPKIVQVLAGLGRSDIPVGAGRTTPLAGSNAFPDPWRQASDQFWGIPLPGAQAASAPVPAAELMVKTLSASTQPMIVFVSGSHTNLAEALRLDPGIKGHIRSVNMMGGSIHVPGNIEKDWPAIKNSTAEWNIWADPVAAAEVFASGLPLHLTPLDATQKVAWTQADASNWASSSSNGSILAGAILQWMLDTLSPEGVYIWDLTAAVHATDPAICPEVPLAVDILLDPGPNQGRTVVKNKPANTAVCLNPDPQIIKGLAAAVLGH